MNNPKHSIRVVVDAANPGQFFACCGLLELAGRVWGEAEGWFEEGAFCIASGGALVELLQALHAVDLTPIDHSDEMASPLRLPPPFDLTLDWWQDERFGGKQLKVWAGSMRNYRIACAMLKAMANGPQDETLLMHSAVVYDPEYPAKKVEPFYYDSRRGWNAQSIDLGFAPDSLQMTTAANPAVEFLCLVGLQRFRPRPTERRRVFEYHTWPVSLPAAVASAAAAGMLPIAGAVRYRFTNAFRTDQKKHKSFLPATPVSTRGEA